MAQLAVRAQCTRHFDELAAASCDHCGAPFCGRCRVGALETAQEFCSSACEIARAAVDPESQDLPPRRLRGLADLRALTRIIGTGWRLWVRSLRALVLLAIGPALLLGAIAWIGAPEPGGRTGEDPGSAPVAVVAAILLAFPLFMALAGAVLSRQYTGAGRSGPISWILTRLAPWSVTWILSLAVSFGPLVLAGEALAFLIQFGFFVTLTLGPILLVAGGAAAVVMPIRLFWADEFALAYRARPMQALHQSWELTKGIGFTVFVFQLILGAASLLIAVPVSLMAFLVGGAFVAAAGLLPGESFGVHSAIVAAVLALAIFLVYSSAHAAELAYFHGVRAARSAQTT